MATYKSIPLSAIHVGDRARPIDEGHALAIAASMADRGLINPITVRGTPATNRGKTPYTLVAGGHRLRAAELNQWQEIDVLVVTVDAAEAELIELSENIYRNELTKLERPLFVMRFRELYEEKFGKITRGGDHRSKGNDYPLIFSPGRELSKEVQNRLGIGAETYKLVTRIGQNLRPELRTLLRGTPAENDQSALLKLAKLPADDQLKVASALKEGAELKAALSWTKPPKPAADSDVAQAGILKRLVEGWEAATEETRREFIDTIGLNADGDALMRTIREAAE